LKQQELALLEEEAKNLRMTQALLAATPAPELASDMSIFLSREMLDSLLSGADGFHALLPGLKDAALTLQSIRCDFRDGFPALKVVGYAERPSQKLRLDLSFSATIATRLDSVSGVPRLLLRVHLTDVVPRARWGLTEYRLRRFAEDLLRAKASTYVGFMPEFSVPLHADLGIAIPPTVKPVHLDTPDGWIEGRLTLPQFVWRNRLAVDHVLFLSDGIHLYASAREVV